MSDTSFTNGVTLTDSDWFNDVNRLHYTIFGDPANTISAAAAIGLDFTNVRVGGTLSVSAGATFNALATTDLSASAVAGLVVATQAQMETGTAVNKIVSPGRLQYHPAAAKAWAKFDASGSAASSFNVTSITDNGTGDFTVNFTVPFSSAHYAINVTPFRADNATRLAYVRSVSATSAQVTIIDATFTPADPTYTMVACYGDQ